MTLRVARLALPFTDDDLATGDIRLTNTNSATSFTITIPLPSVSGVSNGYYNGGDLGTANTATYTLPGESLAMAFAEKIANHGDGFGVSVAEDSTLPGRYIFTRTDGFEWDILWADALTTFRPEWLGFDEATVSSTTQAITADWQAGRLWIAHRPTWNRKREHKKTAHAMTWSGGVSTRQLSGIREEHELKFSAQPGARVYKHDGSIQTLVDMVPGMALDDPNIALESLWQHCASRTPFQHWKDETDLTTSEYLRPLRAESLEGVILLVTAERSNAPPVYDIVMPFVTSTAGAAGVGGGGTVCAVTVCAEEGAVATYTDLPDAADSTDGDVRYVTDMKEAFVFVDTLGGDTLGIWLPSRWANVADFVRTQTADDPVNIVTVDGGGTDTLTSLTAGDWATRTTGGGSTTVTQSGGAILITDTTNSGLASLETEWTANTKLRFSEWLLIVEASVSIGTSLTSFFTSFEAVQTTGSAGYRPLLSFTDGAANEMTLINDSGSDVSNKPSQVTHSRQVTSDPVETTITGFERIFLRYSGTEIVSTGRVEVLCPEIPAMSISKNGTFGTSASTWKATIQTGNGTQATATLRRYTLLRY